MKSAVIVFPGSNCDRDAYTTLKDVGLNPEFVWHGDSALPDNLDLVVLPGGFSYGDYLRCGAMAARSPIVREVIKFAEKGGHVIGICNGFQILAETGLVPGTLMRNTHLKFRCANTNLRVEKTDTAFLSGYRKNQVVNFPIAHAEGNYFADADTIKRMNDKNQIALRYVDEMGRTLPEANPNGAIENIAGVTNEKGNVLGLMPHPERHADAEVGGTDGRIMFESLLRKFAA